MYFLKTTLVLFLTSCLLIFKVIQAKQNLLYWIDTRVDGEGLVLFFSFCFLLFFVVVVVVCLLGFYFFC